MTSWVIVSIGLTLLGEEVGNTYKTYRTNKKLEEEGILITLADGSRWRVSRSNSKRARKALEEARKPYLTALKQADISGITVAEDITDAINMYYTLHGLVHTWEGVTDEAGEDVPCDGTFEKIGKVLSDCPDMHAAILAETQTMANYKDAIEAEATKN